MLQELHPSATGSASASALASHPRTAVEVFDEGFTVLSSPASPVADVIFIHGLQGNPKKTWTYGGQKDPSDPPSLLSKMLHRKAKSSSAETTNTCFWPEDLVSQDFPNYRVATYGYDSRISNFFNGAASQISIVGHGTSLLTALSGLRTDCPTRPIIFVVHSLGGLVLKEALRQSWQAQSYEEDLRPVYKSTIAIIFMGTPHRGSGYADWGIVLRNIAVASGFDASDRNLRDLRGDSPVLEILRKDFAKMLKEEKFDIYTFQESKGFKGVRGLTGKVVEDTSSGLDDARERKDFINTNHMEMCRFSGPNDAGYRKVKEVLQRCMSRPELSHSHIGGTSAPTLMYSPEYKSALASLYAPETKNRLDQVDIAETQTFGWIYDNHDLEFETWLGDTRPLYWIQGKPASGKSTLMKLICNDQRTDDALLQPDRKTVRAAFFFHDRGSHIQKSFNGLLHSILYQLLSSIPELLPFILPAYRDLGNLKTWELEHLIKGFEGILSQSYVKVGIYLFLDALDEYSGDHAGMAKFLRGISQDRLPSKSLVKVCFSSRPLQIFLDRFKDVPGFQLQKYTEEDISTVIRARMEDSERFVQYFQSPDELDREAVESIIEEIQRRADGVFLWVKLVLDELIEEFRAGAELNQLHTRLLIIPTDLDAYYQRTYNKIPARYQEENQIMFEILACALDTLGLYDFMHIFKYATIQKLADCRKTETISHEKFLDTADRLIRSRSGGLIEIKSVPEDSRNFSLTLLRNDHYVVQFIHQTVKTFSQRSSRCAEMATASSVSPPRHNGYVYLLKYLLAYIAGLPTAYSKDHDRFEHSSIMQWIEALLNYANLAEKTTKFSNSEILCQVKDQQVCSFFSHGMWVQEMQYPLIESLISLAIVADLPLFLAEQGTPEAIHRKYKVPLLHLAVHDRLTSSPFIRESPVFNGIYNRVMIVETLLQRGARTTDILAEQTAFQMVLSPKMQEPPFWSVDMIKLFLSYNQDPNICVSLTGGKSTRPGLGRRLDRHLYGRPLHLAVRNNRPELLSCLLEYGAIVNALDGHGRTPLDWAFKDLLDDLEAVLITDSPQSYESTPKMRRMGGRPFYLPESLQSIKILLAAGGKRSPKTSEAIEDESDYEEDFVLTQQGIVDLRKLGLDVDDSLLNLPYLRSAWSGRLLDLASAASSMVTGRRRG